MKTYTVLGLLVLGMLPMKSRGEELLVPTRGSEHIRVATFNTSFSKDESDGLIKELQRDSQQAKRIAAVLRVVRPDIVLLNEFDYSPDKVAEKLFIEKYLAAQQGEIAGEPIEYPYRYSAEVNTGEPSGLDLDNNGKTDDPNDAWGFGKFPGHYGMLLLSNYPIREADVRSFRKFLWSELPGAKRPSDPTNGKSYYSDSVWKQLRLSSKSHWDVPIETPQGIIHLLCSHPTPPAFDGPENRNGNRNHDEIRLWKEYIENNNASFLKDDAGKPGGLKEGSPFIIAGDLNADPVDGDDQGEAIKQLLNSPQINSSMTPRADGGKESAQRQGKKNSEHKGDPAEDTSDFNDRNPGNLRVDYVLPSTHFKIIQSGIFWPTFKQCMPIDPNWMSASDHRLVWIDISK
jgi:endonuclease/exonuclease/phosphatase family metal-dependent hydrolase